ncbi:nucleotidyltransferase domain-containing protein [Algoriphagus persicinus]|uniref:nucleotidyltransferase domain-containing protein n=1 Tax=Algoriphagus persicinus TaxID=3108754 RepID=UPI002B3CF2BC|nr:nucleotidyltransferase domain-containing protein [Algoriphagus sp. E1-3-M2]MEB2783419.1 nucleotidyltransferase domain-containing protein [Algoriphagus sp. E1-3-M2]
MSDKEEIVKGILEMASTRYPNSELYLFGSQTNDSAIESSDWDILMLLDSDYVPLSKEIAIMDDFYELELQTGAIISPIIYSKSDWNKTRRSTLLFEKISKDAVRIK